MKYLLCELLWLYEFKGNTKSSIREYAKKYTDQSA